MHHEYLWQTLNPAGWEHVRINDDHQGWDVFDSVLMRVDGDAVRRGGYTLVLDKAWQALEIRCLIETEPGVMGSIHLLSEGDGVWFDENEQRLPELDGCYDIAITGSPLAVTTPLRRLNLQSGQQTWIRIAEISLPDLSLRVNNIQLRRDGSMIEYGDTTPLQVDGDGFVLRSENAIMRVFPNQVLS